MTHAPPPSPAGGGGGPHSGSEGVLLTREMQEEFEQTPSVALRQFPRRGRGSGEYNYPSPQPSLQRGEGARP